MTDRLINWLIGWLVSWLVGLNFYRLNTGEMENEYMNKINFRFHKIGVIWSWVAIEISDH